MEKQLLLIERFIDLNFEFISKQREILEIFEVNTKGS